ncbi:hypothetical protein BGZ58_010842 [Dissophora ornata]|nr:hypothetical protein BGZ58_010842 [Dissophora ornata]
MLSQRRLSKCSFPAVSSIRFNSTDASTYTAPSAAEDSLVALKKAAKKAAKKADRKAAKRAARETAKDVKFVASESRLHDEPCHGADGSMIKVQKAKKLKLLRPGPVAMPLSPKPARKPRIRAAMESKQRGAHSRIGSATERAPSPTASHEKISETIQILCEAMEEAQVSRVRKSPPVFLASTFEQAEQAMELFSEYYKTTEGELGPVGFDTETTTAFVPRNGSGVSLVQIATRDVCVMFQVYRIARAAPKLFPTRLKAFLEDPMQLLVGVAAAGDAKELRQSYNVNCAGVVSLEVMAKERQILARSLADLDAMFGRPGREVIKTRALLGWNWDSAVLDPRWAWYAAKDAFAGLAIYENMLTNTIKENYLPYELRYPMTEAEQATDIFLWVKRAIGGGGKKSTVGAAESTIATSYARFRKVYQPAERVEQAEKYLKILIQDGRIALEYEKDSSSVLNKDDVVKIAGRRLSSMLATPEGVDVLSPFFNGRRVDVLTLPSKGISLSEVDFPAEKDDQDMRDLRLFLELAWVWDQPRKLKNVISIYSDEITAAENREAGQDAVMSLTHQMDSTELSVVEDETSEPSEAIGRVQASHFCHDFLERMRKRGVVHQHYHEWKVVPEIEQRCLEAVPYCPPVLKSSEKQLGQPAPQTSTTDEAAHLTESHGSVHDVMEVDASEPAASVPAFGQTLA